MHLRQPEAGDLDALNALILRSKAVHGYDTDFMAACVDELRVTAEDLDRDQIVLAEDTDGLIGMAQVRFGPDRCDLDKLYVDPARIGRGAGQVLFRWAAEVAARGGAKAMFIDADPNAEAFYRRMGAVRVGEVPSGSIPGRTLPLMKLPIAIRSE